MERRHEFTQDEINGPKTPTGYPEVSFPPPPHDVHPWVKIATQQNQVLGETLFIKTKPRRRK